MQKRILVSIAALAVTSAVAAAAVNTSIGSNVTEPVAEPAVRTAPSVAAASPERSASEQPPTVVAEPSDAPSETATAPEEQQSSAAASSEAAGAATPEEAASSESAKAEASPSQASPAAQTSSAKPQRETADRSSRAQAATQRENVVAGGGGQGRSAAEIPGWRMDYFEGFEGSIEDTGWERYGWGNPKVGHGAMGIRTLDNTFTSGGELLVRTKYENGQWSAGGASTKQVFTASRGRWEVRARMPEAKGIGYVFLLWPKDEGWPPEIDFAEGRVNGPEVMGVYHWDPDNKQEHRFFDNHSMHDWHTYGVIVEEKEIIFTIDGKEWGRIEKNWITDKEMFLGVQTGAMDPNGSEARYETVPNGVPGPETPAISDIQIDWVAHYTRG